MIHIHSSLMAYFRWNWVHCWCQYQYGFAYDGITLLKNGCFPIQIGWRKMVDAITFTETGSYFYDKCDDLSGAKFRRLLRVTMHYSCQQQFSLKANNCCLYLIGLKILCEWLAPQISGELSIAKIKNKESKDAILKFMQAADFTFRFREDGHMEAELKKMPIELQDNKD